MSAKLFKRSRFLSECPQLCRTCRKLTQLSRHSNSGKFIPKATWPLISFIKLFSRRLLALSPTMTHWKPVCLFQIFLALVAVIYRAIGGLGIALFRLMFVHGHKMPVFLAFYEDKLREAVRIGGIVMAVAISCLRMTELLLGPQYGESFALSCCMKVVRRNWFIPKIILSCLSQEEILKYPLASSVSRAANTLLLFLNLTECFSYCVIFWNMWAIEKLYWFSVPSTLMGALIRLGTDTTKRRRHLYLRTNQVNSKSDSVRKIIGFFSRFQIR